MSTVSNIVEVSTTKWLKLRFFHDNTVRILILHDNTGQILNFMTTTWIEIE